MKCRGMDGEVERGVVFLNTIFEGADQYSEEYMMWVEYS